MITTTLPLSEKAILSNQVSGSRYFFLGLAPSPARFTLIYGGHEQCDPDYLVQRDGFPCAALELVSSGRGWVRLNGRLQPLRPGSAFIYTRTTRLEIRADPAAPMAKYFLCFTGADAPARLRQAGMRANRVTHLALFAEVQNLIEILLREGQHHRPLTATICASLAEALLLKIEDLQHATDKGNSHAEELFLRCKGLIDGQSDRLASLDHMIKTTGVETSRLCRLFRRYQGMSPYQYLLRRKMAFAAELLMNSDCLVKEAAARVGFSDPYHFSRCFKKVHHLPPRKFQRSLQRN
jgi:AraC-like DNA-binding protein